VDRLHHALKDRVEDLPRLFGIAGSQQFHGTRQVGKQHRNLFLLALEGALGREDLLGQMLGSVRLGGGKLHHSGGSDRTLQYLPTLVTKSALRRVGVRARWTNGQQPHAAGVTIFRLWWVLLLAA